MRVLMFGWEFPPHISGGLGTACFGLTKGLVEEDVDLIFVVPKLQHPTQQGKLQLVNASDIVIPFNAASLQKKILKKKIKKIRYSNKQIPVTHKKAFKTHTHVSWIEVESSLTPYTSPDTTLKSWAIEDWNYRFSTELRNERLIKEEEILEAGRDHVDGLKFNFTGTYGPSLMKEVEQYAQVGRELGRTEEFDAIHAHDWMTFAAGIEAKKISGKPLVVHVHATEFDRAGNCMSPVYKLEKAGMDAADKVVAVSQWTKDILVKHYRIAPTKITVVHNGIIAKEPTTTSQMLPPIGSHVVTFLGRITYQKGPRYFVEAARKVLQHFPDAHFIVAGSGDLLPQTIDRVAALKLSKNFHFTGFLNQELINAIWALSDVYVMPSVSEPFGITPLEAVQAGVPVIVSKQSGVSEVMEHALKVDFWDVDSLADAICSMLRYKSLSVTMKQKGEQEIQEITWHKAAKKLKRVYHELTT